MSNEFELELAKYGAEIELAWLKYPSFASSVKVNKDHGLGWTILHHAMENNDVDKVKLLLEIPETKLGLKDDQGNTPLHSACLKNSSDVIPLYCRDARSTSAILNSLNLAGRSPFKEAMSRGNSKCIEALTRVDSVVNYCTSDGLTLLHRAMGNNNENLVRLLLASPVTKLGLPAVWRGVAGNTPLHIACKENCVAVIKLFCRDSRCTPDIVNILNLRQRFLGGGPRETPIMVAMFQENLDCIEVLLNMPGVLNSQDKDGRTALHHAMEYNKSSTLRLLLAKPEARLDIMDNDGCNPLYRAPHEVNSIFCQDRRCTSDVLNNKNKNGWTALHRAMDSNSSDTLSLLLAMPEARLNIIDENGCNPLHLACQKNNVEVISMFCQDRRCTPDVLNKKNKEGHSPVMAAVVHQRGTRALKKLSEVQGVDWNTNNEGKTLLEIAKELKNRKRIENFLTELIACQQQSQEDVRANDRTPAQKENLNKKEAVDISHIADVAINIGSELKKLNSEMVGLETELDQLEETAKEKRSVFEKKQQKLLNIFDLKQEKEKKEEIKNLDLKQEKIAVRNLLLNMFEIESETKEATKNIDIEQKLQKTVTINSFDFKQETEKIEEIKTLDVQADAAKKAAVKTLLMTLFNIETEKMESIDALNLKQDNERKKEIEILDFKQAMEKTDSIQKLVIRQTVEKKKAIETFHFNQKTENSKEIQDFDFKQETEKKSFLQTQQTENKSFNDFVAKSLEENRSEKKRKLIEFKDKVQDKKGRLQAGVGTSSSIQHQLIPECPVCLDPMAAPKKVYNCRNGHLICVTCKPKVKICATCRKGNYMGRATAMEQMIRKIMKIDT